MRYLMAPAALAMVSCATMQPLPAPPSTEPTTVEASFGKTWDAVIDYFATNNIGVRTLDRQSGFIVAERASIAPSMGELTYAQCPGTAFDQFLVNTTVGPTSASYNLVVRGDSARSTVKVNIRFVRVKDGVAADCVSKGEWERALESFVKKRAERAPTTRSRPALR